MDNKPQALRELALFAGAGGGILGGKLLGWETICAVEFNAYARSVLLARQNDGTLSPFPIWDDVRTFDGKPWRGLVDVVSGGFPCQDISVAGAGAGIDGERSGLWSEFNRIIGEIRPRFAFIENSPMLVTRGLDRVLCDLASMGYDAEWGIVSAADCGAPHQRERMWIVAHASDKGIHERWGFDSPGKDGERLQGNVRDGLSRSGQEETEILADTESIRTGHECKNIWEGLHKINSPNNASGDSGGHDKSGEREKMAHATSAQCEREQFSKRSETQYANTCTSSWWAVEPAVGRVANGVASRADRLKAIGNGQVPIVAATAWSILNARS